MVSGHEICEYTCIYVISNEYFDHTIIFFALNVDCDFVSLERISSYEGNFYIESLDVLKF